MATRPQKNNFRQRIAEGRADAANVRLTGFCQRANAKRADASRYLQQRPRRHTPGRPSSRIAASALLPDLARESSTSPRGARQTYTSSRFNRSLCGAGCRKYAGAIVHHPHASPPPVHRAVRDKSKAYFLSFRDMTDDYRQLQRILEPSHLWPVDTCTKKCIITSPRNW